MSEEIKEIMEQEFERHGNPSLRKFADWVTEKMSKEGDSMLSHATVLNWLDGKPPQTDFLQDMLSVYPVTDRRFVLALKLLAAKSPHVWGFQGVVWRLREAMSTTE
jgi:hypothetical protein